jgi:hypothetical protein
MTTNTHVVIVFDLQNKTNMRRTNQNEKENDEFSSNDHEGDRERENTDQC